MTKIDDGILQLKIDTLTESLLKCTNKFSNLHSKYHKEVNGLKPEFDEKKAEVNTYFLFCVKPRVKHFEINI